ncbi:immunity 52 family protein [Xenorhabdus sp. IM139775]|uniref:immunity 52 family protein n=1 Tax=Xenorhabdus sp. IM139775 TaxID=3025876 RepID=UPI002358F979|nr:immunity 52 family protein [Xenorhabdus sp. IM139775]MDC9595092.1 immunity 52 family protein [Xenorhabdus sp. IM139775]
MTTLSLEIRLYFDWKEPLTPKIALADLHKITQQINTLFVDHHKTWYLPGNTRQEALLHIAFDTQGATEKAIKEFEKDYTENDPMVIKGIWDGEDDGHSCSIYYQNYRRDQLGQTEITLNISIGEKEFQLSRLIEFIKDLISSRNLPYILVEANGYSLYGKQVFPDRLSAGWMLYLPTEIDSALLTMAEEIIFVSDKNDKKGSLIITTKDIFDIENQEHINKANDIEICLRDLQLLPLISEI